ncbi:MAG: hypothetical protein AMXMBFR84_05540 [Candidatus Hydrogenedentota bacterium]
MHSICRIALLIAATGALAETPFYADKSNLLTYRAADGSATPVTTAQDWANRRNHILENVQKVAGPFPGKEKEVPFDPVADPDMDMGSYVRRKMTIAVEAGDRLPVYLLIPKKGTSRRPAMVCLHQTSVHGKDEVAGLAESTTLDYGHELAERGYVVIAPDYPNMGEYKVDPYALGYASTTMKAIWNHKRCVDYLVSLSEVDSGRIGAIGHSLGGHNSLFLGLFDERIQCIVTSCGFCSFSKYYGGNLTGWSHNGYMPRIATDFGKDPAKMPFDFTEVLASLAPRAVFINAPMRDDNFDWTGVRDCVDAAKPVYALLQAADRLEVRYPDCEHEFPDELRNSAYACIDTAIGPAETNR